jgi:UDP-3-O-[3-hydroxymyristoyl] glucosamine N-acyltransferase
MILQELLDELGGNLAQGDVEWIVDAVSAYETASAFDLAFAESEAAVAAALKSNAGTIVLKQGMATEYPKGKCIIETEQPKLWFAKAAKLVRKPPLSLGIAPGAVVAPDAKVDPAVFVGSNAVVGSRIGAGAIVGEFVKIGIECTIYPRVVIYPGVTLGDRVVVHAGAVLGADGFGYVRDTETGAYTHFPQQGKLVIEDDVEIGANSTIDRGALKETRIRKGTKMDNLVHVGHNCEVGPDAILVALTGISGSSTIGKGAVLAGQVGIGDHVHVGEGVILGGQSGVFNGKTITNEGHKPGTVMFGTPARPLKQVLREQATLSRLAKNRERGDKGTADKDRE